MRKFKSFLKKSAITIIALFPFIITFILAVSTHGWFMALLAGFGMECFVWLSIGIILNAYKVIKAGKQPEFDE